MLLICGDALIDFLPFTTPAGRTGFLPRPGGSSCNIAIAIGRLGIDVGFVGGLSTDLFGTMLSQALTTAGVRLDHAARIELGSTLAFVSVRDGEPEYAFFDEMSAARMWTRTLLPRIGDDVSLIHAGSIALIPEPAATEYLGLFRENKGRRLLSLDPNCRPSLVADRPAYRDRIGDFLSLSDIIKLSVSDYAFLAPDGNVDDAARSWISAGAKLVVVTRGSAGATAFFRNGEITVPAVPTEVRDTVGAGDTYIGALLAFLDKAGCLAGPGLDEIDGSLLARGLAFAGRAAAITCGREGADPPWLDELRPAFDWPADLAAGALVVERPRDGIEAGAGTDAVP